MPHSLDVGFIGLGDQGRPMAEAVAERGFPLHVWARRPSSLSSLSGVNYTVHSEVAAVAAASNLIALCLRDDADLWDVFDHQGLLAALRPGTIVVNHATGDPAEAVRLAAHVAAAGGVLLDAPVSGGSPGATARTLTTFVGGDPSAYETSRPVFASFSTTVRRMGDAGSGQLTKLLNNALTITNMHNASEVLTIADGLGLDLPALMDVISVSSGASFALRALGQEITPELAPHLQGLMRKDMGHFADAVRARGLDPDAVYARGLAGADGLVAAVDVVRRIS